MALSNDPNVDQVLGDGVIHFSGTPDEVREWLLVNIPMQSCLVWVGATQSTISGHDYLAA
jgi:hypothetical protein